MTKGAFHTPMTELALVEACDCGYLSGCHLAGCSIYRAFPVLVPASERCGCLGGDGSVCVLPIGHGDEHYEQTTGDTA